MKAVLQHVIFLISVLENPMNNGAAYSKIERIIAKETIFRDESFRLGRSNLKGNLRLDAGLDITSI